MHFKDPQGDQSCKGCSKNVTSVENGDSCGQLFARVECRQNVQCSWIVWSLRDTEEEPRKQEARVISTDSSQATDDSPHSHARGHPDAGLHPCDHHVRRNTNDNVSGEQNGDTSLVLLRSQAKVLFESVQAGECDCIAVLEHERQLVSQRISPKQSY